MSRMHISDVLNAAIASGVSYKLFVDLSGKRRVGTVIKFNKHTVWVKVMKGARTYDIIKRHRFKHGLYMPASLMGRGKDETLYTSIRDEAQTD